MSSNFALRFVAIAVMADYMGVGMMRTLLPFYAKKLGGDAALIGMLETVYGIGQLIGASFMGGLSDTWGRRPVLMLSFTGSALGYGMAGVATSPWLLLLSRIPVGLAKQTVTVSRAIISDCTDKNARSRAMSLLVAQFAVGYMLGPFLGGYLTRIAGNAAPALITCLLFCTLIPSVMLFLPETCQSRNTCRIRKQISNTRITRLQWKNHKAVILAVSILALAELALIMHTTTALSVFAIRSGQDVQWLGKVNSLLGGLVALFSFFVIPYLSSTRNWLDQDILLAGNVCFIIVAVIIGCMQSKVSVEIATIPMGFAAAVLRSCPASFISKHVESSLQGAVMGLLDTISSALRIIAPICTGLLIKFSGEIVPFIIEGILCFLCVICLTIFTNSSFWHSYIKKNT